MLQSGLRRAWRAIVNARTLVLIALLAIIGGALPVRPVAAAGNGVLTVEVTILDANGLPTTVVDPAVSTQYSVNVAYSCSTANCDSTTVKVAPTPLDPYYGTHRREGSFTVTPPPGVTPTTTGNLSTGLTINLGNLPVGTSTSLRVNYVAGGGSYFPDGSLVQAQATIDSPTATGPKTDTASAEWRISVPNPTAVFSAPVRTRTDLDMSFNLGLSNSGCVRRVNGIWSIIPSMLCAGAYSVSVQLPANAEYISGGTYDAGTRTVTWSASGDTAAVAHGYGAGAVPIAIRFPADLYPTTSPGCVVDEPFAVDYTVTYLDGTVKTASTDGAVQVQNCTPFAKGTMNKAFTVAGTTSAVTTVAVPTVPGTTKGVAWQVTASNQANVEGVATIVDDTLDQDDLSVTGVQVLAGGPATVTYTLDNATTATVTVNQNAIFTVPAGRYITKVTAVSSELIGPNTLPSQGALTSFTVRFLAQLPAEATLGTRTNTATGTISYPNYPALSAVPLQAARTITITGPAAAGVNASALTALLGNPPVTPVAGTEVPWTARGQYSNVPVGSAIRPQYVFVAPAGWTIVPNGATMEAGAPAGITLAYRTLTIGGVSRQAVVADWPGVVGQSGTVTLPLMTIRTVPTTSATPGTNNQLASLFVGDADNGDFATYTQGKYTDADDIDNDGVTIESFGQRNTSISLAPTTAVGALKEICKPDPAEVDGCDWIADSSVRVGVPPSASSIKYRLTIQNLGNGTLNNVVGYDVLPYVGDTGTTNATASTPRGSTVKEQLVSVSDVSAGLTLTYSTSTNPPRPEVFAGTTSGTFTSTVAGASTIRMAVASLPAGESRSFVYVAGLVGGAADQVACNSVAITATTLTAIEAAPVCATTQEADFSITADDRFPLQEGRAGIVPFVVNQGGGSALASGTVTIAVPQDVTVGNLALTPDWRCEAAPSTTGPTTVTCIPVKPDTTRRQLPLNVPETISLQVIPAAGTAGTALCFDAEVEGLINDPEASNDTVTSCSDVVAALSGVSVDKDDGVAIVAPGAQTTYTIDVANVLTAETVTDVVLTDTLPANATLVSATPAPTTTVGGTLTWNLADLAPAGVLDPDGDVATGGAGSTQTITVTVAVSPSATGTVVNTATVTAADPVSGADLTATDDDIDTVQSAALTLTKTANPAGVNTVGDDVTYTFVVTNSGNVPLSGVAIEDPLAGLSAIDCGGVTTLAASADVECTATYEASAADFAAGQIVNTATASGQPAIGPAIESPAATATVDAEAAPRLDLTKDATEANFDAAGDQIHFTFGVTNSGNVALSGLAVADQLPGTTPVSCVATSLAPGASTTCSTTYTTTQADVDAGEVVNTATATATAANGAPVTSAPAQTAVPSVRNAGMTMVKSAAEASFAAADTVLHYRFVVTNTGNVTLTGVDVTDDLAGLSEVTCPSATLPVGQSMTCTATYTTSQGDVDAGGVDNTATATATEVADAPSSHTVPADSNPAIAIVKTVADTRLDSAGQVLDYTFAVTNTGNQTLTGVSVTDPFPGLVMDGCGATTLAPGESTNCTAHYTVTQQNIDEADQLTNTATASGTPPVGPVVVSAPDSASVPPVVAPELTVDKTSQTGSFDAIGTAITFDFAVENTGNVTIDNLAINDPLPGVGPATCDDVDGVLPPGASTNCRATYTTTQADLDNGGVTNTATASGSSPSGAPVVSNIDTLEIDAVQSPAATLVKGGAADVGDVDTVGEQVTFTFDVHNTGNVTLTGLAITDDLVGVSAVSCPSNVLVVDGQVRCTATYAVTQADLDAGVITNHASVGSDQDDDLAEHTFALDTAQNGAISLDKVAATSSFDGPGQTLSYTFSITNAGNVTLTDIELTDGGANVTCTPPASLAPGDPAVSCTGTYTTTQEDVDLGSFVNTASVSASAAGGATVNAEDSATVNALQSPDIELTKTVDAADGQFDAAGTVITYELTVVNTGNVTLSGVTVIEQLTGTSPTTDCNATELAPDAETTCFVTYTATQQDVDNGSLTNTAEVTSTGPGAALVDDTASVTLTAVQRPGWTFAKSADDDGFDAAGDVLTFTLTVTNTGNVTFTDIDVTDALPDATVDCPTTVLTPQDDPLECTATYTVTQRDVDNGVVVNEAHVSATVPGSEEPWEQGASATVIGTQSASIALVKSADEPSFAAAGQTLHYRFVVTNTGNVTLTDMTVVDALTGLSAIACPVSVLAPAASTTCTATYVTAQADVDAGRVVNTATASATAPAADPEPLLLAVVTVSADSTVTVPAVQSPGFQLVKSVEETSFTAGSTLHYRFLITNTGNTTIQQLAVNDPLPGLSPVSCPVASLAPGESTTCTATYVATATDVANGKIVNTATVVGVPTQGDQLVSSPSTVEVSAVVIPPPPSPTTPPAGPNVPDELPATGSDSNRIVNVAVSLLLAGLLALAIVHRRRRRTA